METKTAAAPGAPDGGAGMFGETSLRFLPQLSIDDPPPHRASAQITLLPVSDMHMHADMRADEIGSGVCPEIVVIVSQAMSYGLRPYGSASVHSGWRSTAVQVCRDRWSRSSSLSPRSSRVTANSDRTAINQYLPPHPARPTWPRAARTAGLRDRTPLRCAFTNMIY